MLKTQLVDKHCAVLNCRHAEVPASDEGQRPAGDGAVPRPDRRQRHGTQRLPHAQDQ